MSHWPAARNRTSWYRCSWRGLRSGVLTPDDSRLLTSETTPASFPTTFATAPRPRIWVVSRRPSGLDAKPTFVVVSSCLCSGCFAKRTLLACVLTTIQMLSRFALGAAKFFPPRRSANAPMCRTPYWFRTAVRSTSAEGSEPPTTDNQGMRIQKRGVRRHAATQNFSLRVSTSRKYNQRMLSS
jgi:hypothetical protein